MVSESLAYLNQIFTSLLINFLYLYSILRSSYILGYRRHSIRTLLERLF